MEDDAQSVISSVGSELLPERTQVPFTQEQLDAVRSFVECSRTLGDLRKQSRELNQAIKKHREVLVALLKERRKTRLVLNPETKIELQHSVVKKRPTSKQLHSVFYYTLQSEGNDVFGRIKAKLERNLKEVEVSVQKESLTLKTGEKRKKQRPSSAAT